MPAVSVVMSVYNGEPYLAQAIHSILTQSFEDFEFVIIDDASQDHSVQTIRSFEDPRIHLVRNRQNIGLTRSLNRGLKLARGQFVARMDADDVSLPRRLESQMAFLKTYPKVEVLGGSVRLIDEKGKNLGKRIFPTHHELIRWSLCLFDPIPHPTVMIHRDVLEKVAGYRTEMTTAQDYDLWTRLSSITRMANLPEVMVELRRHDGSVRLRHRDEHRRNRIMVSHQMLEAYLHCKIPFETVEHIWERNCRSIEEMRSAASLLLHLYEVGMANERFSKKDQQFIREYIARRLFSLAHRRTDNGRAWDIVTKSCQLDPLVIPKAIRTRLHRHIRQIWAHAR